MGLVRRHCWFVAAAGITLAFAVVCLVSHKPSSLLNAFADVFGLVLMLLGFSVCLANTFSRPREERSFWILMVLSFSLWTANQLAWTIREAVLHLGIPDPFVFDIVLFFHTVPMIAAVAWRPDLPTKRGKILASVLNFLMLLLSFPTNTWFLTLRNTTIIMMTCTRSKTPFWLRCSSWLP
jgi:hypothetical protein